MSWNDIKYYPLTVALLLMLLFTACSLVLVIGKANTVTTEQTDDPTTEVQMDSINVLTTAKERKEHKPKK